VLQLMQPAVAGRNLVGEGGLAGENEASRLELGGPFPPKGRSTHQHDERGSIAAPDPESLRQLGAFIVLSRLRGYARLNPLGERDEVSVVSRGYACLAGCNGRRAAKLSGAHALSRGEEEASFSGMGTCSFEDDLPSRRARVRDLPRNPILLRKRRGTLRLQMEQVTYAD
jgi:hypothetical protein